MTRIMRDSTNAHDIPLGTPMVAGYVDGGLYAWSDADWEYHRGSQFVRITVTGNTLDADVIDIESGTVGVAQGVAWAKRMVEAGKYPTLYFSESLWDAVQTEMAAAGIHSFGIWYAAWGADRSIRTNAVAHQWGDPAFTGHHYDESVVVDYPHWPGVDVPAPPPPPPPPPGPNPNPTPTDAVAAVRAAWTNLTNVLTIDLVNAISAVAAAVSKLQPPP